MVDHTIFLRANASVYENIFGKHPLCYSGLLSSDLESNISVCAM